MAPTPTYPSPQVQLGRLMVEARRRGLSFDEWWEEAVRPRDPVVMVNTPPAKRPAGAVLWPTDYTDRTTWRAAILGTREGWRRAYLRYKPTKEEAALALLLPALEALAEAEAEGIGTQRPVASVA